MAGGSSSKKSSVQGAWLGSDVDEELIDALRHHRLLPPARQVSVHLPSSEASPACVAGEVVVFVEHFSRGFGLPASSFFAEWLQFFGLQPHHLVPNAILQLAAFVVLCEGFMGIEPRVDLWRSLFFFKQQSIAMEKSEVEKLKGPRPMTPCGAALLHHRPKSGFPQMPLQDSVKHWQKGFFYVRSTDPAQDALNMPPFAITPPTRQNWDAKTPKPHPEVALIRAHLDILRESGLLGRDLLATMMVRRILPLQRRPHLVCQMSGRLDPCWLSTKRFTPGAVARRVNLISTARMDEGGEWTWRMSPFNRAHPPPMMFKTLEGSLRPPAPDMEASGASEMEDEDAMEPRSGSSTGSGDLLESEGTEPSAWLDREEEDADEDTASVAERAGWAAADAANRELETESKRQWDTAAGKAAVGQPCPSRFERSAEKRAKARQDPSAHAHVEEPASEAASRPNPRTEGAQLSEPAAPEQVDLETIPVSPRAEAAPEASVLDLTALDAAPNDPGATMDAPDVAHPPPAEEVAPAGTAPEPTIEPAPGAGAIIIPQQGPVAPRVGGRLGSRPMKSWRAANLARLRMPADTILSGVPELVTLFTSGRSKLEQAARMACGDMERLEARTQAEKKELEAAGRVELEPLRATLQEKEASYTANVDRLASLHLEEANLKDAALRAKD
ncbi:hypothetical protein D1007_14489 [Hordeum vulgare]|nr:hypothetical protein D1007_14489 [Hordeum vulgare]